MGYSTSIRAVKKMENYLIQMVNTNERITWISDDPSQLSYRILNAFHAAKYNALNSKKEPIEPYVTYARLKQKFTIRIGKGLVIADPTDVIAFEPVRQGLNRITIPKLTSYLEIVGAAFTHKAAEMFFPDAIDEDELPLIYAWGSKHGYYLIPSDDGLTLTQTDPGDLAWTPNEV